MKNKIPDLEPYCGSWICTIDFDGEQRIQETFDRVCAENLADKGWTVKTAAQYLGEYNQAVKMADARRKAADSFNAQFLKGTK